jgi:hypothetical protein
MQEQHQGIFTRRIALVGQILEDGAHPLAFATRFW